MRHDTKIKKLKKNYRPPTQIYTTKNFKKKIFIFRNKRKFSVEQYEGQRLIIAISGTILLYMLLPLILFLSFSSI